MPHSSSESEHDTVSKTVKDEQAKHITRTEFETENDEEKKSSNGDKTDKGDDARTEKTEQTKTEKSKGLRKDSMISLHK